MFAACIASGSCGGTYGNLANLGLGSYGNPSSSSSSSSAAAAAPNSYGANYAAPGYGVSSYGAPVSYGGQGYAAPISAYSTPSATYTAPAKSYGPKYTVQPAYATELYPGQQNYKAYNSPATYSQIALPIAPSAPVAKLYVPAQPAYAANTYNSGVY